MDNKRLLKQAEKILTETWDQEVHLSLIEQQDEHRQVMQFAVHGNSPGTPQTVILKRRRLEGEERFSDEFGDSHFLNDWAGLEFLAAVFGDGSLAPKRYAGDKNTGILLMEDISGEDPFQDAFWGKEPSKAAQVMVRYGEGLGLLHGKTIGHQDLYCKIREQLGGNETSSFQNYFHNMRTAAASLDILHVEVPQAAQEELHQAAQILSQPGNFSAFTHGDPVFGNMIEWRGSRRLIDFEAANFRHALLEGVYPRMFFPTSGLKYVLRIPENIWRQAERAYRKVLCQYCAAASDDAIYGDAISAACAFWVLDICRGWLESAVLADTPAVMRKRIRQCIISRAETFIKTSQEFQRMLRLGDFFDQFVTKLRSQWTDEECDLPFYPAFR
jgi:tRNA A-37 threonylcarbamoyl transferase component Bud32